jgi:predicted Zn-dependent peptidase
VILEEINVYLDTPRRYVSSVYDDLVYGDQPIGWDVIGTRETVSAATRETFVSFLDEWYAPERMVVGISGQLGEGLTERLEELLGDIQPRATGMPTAAERRDADSPILVYEKPSEQAHIVLGVRGYPLRHPDRYAVQLLGTVLGGGMSSRLFTEVRDNRGLAYFVYASSSSYTDEGTFYSQAGVDLKRIDEAISVIAGELRRIAEDPVPADELEKARGYAKGRFVLALESPQSMIQFGLRRLALEDVVEDPAEILQALDQVTVDDLTRVAGDLIAGKRLYLAVVGPFDDPTRFEPLIAA